ncbi:MAG: hypothetical protein IPP91_17700 [Betaproteobacteria bacterium]|nr:hypothetical protein [Betaproteobacteria bacterium]
MKKLVILVAALFATAAIAQDKGAPHAAKGAETRGVIAAAPGKGVAAAEVTTVVSTVEAIDQATRTVTLKGKDGKTATFVVGPDAKNLDQVKKGDVVTFDYVEAVAIKLAKSTSKVRERIVTQVKKGADKGKQPAGVIGTEVKIIASVDAIDAKANKVTLRGPEHAVTLKVDPAVLKKVKVGEMVEATFVEAIMIKVEKPAAAAAPAMPTAPAKK